MRIALGVEYDGTIYHGWQRQDHDGLITVQGTLEDALGQVANERHVEVFCAGRTDAGVHALSQVVHFDTQAERSEYSWIFGTNSNLPHDVRVLWAKRVDEEFHARYTATARQYRYLIYNDPLRPAIFYKYATWHRFQLDENRMHEAAQYLLGEHDFTSFRGADCQAKTPHRHITHISVQRNGHWLMLDIKADAFLHHMVRNIAGVLFEIGEGKREIAWTQQILQEKNRSVAGVTAPPNGLYLVAVDYPEKYHLPKINKKFLFECI